MSNNLTLMISYVRMTRRYGQTYVHADVRQAVYGWQGLSATLDGRQVLLTYRGWGRSLESGGHKYKAHARYQDTGRPVLTKDLLRICP